MPAWPEGDAQDEDAEAHFNGGPDWEDEDVEAYFTDFGAKAAVLAEELQEDIDELRSMNSAATSLPTRKQTVQARNGMTRLLT